MKNIFTYTRLLLLGIVISISSALQAQCDIEVTVFSASWGDATTWTLTDGSGATILSGGPYANGYSDTQTAFNASNPPYTLTLVSTLGDNTPEYTVSAAGVTIASGIGVANNTHVVNNLSCPNLSCPPPLGTSVNLTSQTEAIMTWSPGGTETNWNVEYGAPGFTPGTGTGTALNTSNTTETFTGLVPFTNYSFYVQGICGPGDESFWAGPFNIYTGYCMPQYSTTSEYMSSFVSTSGVTNINYNTSFYPTGGYENLIGTQIASVELGDDLEFDHVYTPNFGHTIAIWVDWDNNLVYDASEQMYFFYSTVGANNGSFVIPGGTAIGTYNMRVRVSYGNATNLEPCNMQTWGSAIDVELEILPPPSCPRPSSIVASNITAHEADLDWVLTGTETEWEIQYDTTGFVPGTGNSVITNNNPETLIGLTDNTEYQAYVRGICAPGDTSNWRGPVTFKTLCTTFSAIDFCEDFSSTSNTKDCWTVIDANNDGDAWDLNYAFNPHVGDMVATLYTDFNNGNNDDYLITPSLTLTNNEVMSFSYRVQSTFEPDAFQVLLSTTGTAPADFLDTLMDVHFYDNIEYLDTTLDLSAFSGDVFIAFHVPPTPGQDGWRLYIDNFCIDVCVPAPGQDGSEQVCRLDEEMNLNDLIVRGQMNGTWNFPASQNLIVNDSMMQVSTLPSGTYEAYYIVQGGCTADTTVATFEIFPPSSAGQNGTITACLNQPLDLFSGLNGNIDMGGTWYDPQDNALQNSMPVAANIPGSYNYDYIVSNGVCPADTQYVEVIVSGTCNYLSVGESELGNIEVYPNPATDVIKIDNNSNAEALVIEVMDMNGRLVLSDANALFNNNHATISIESLETGVYTLRLSNKEGQRTFKVVKQ